LSFGELCKLDRFRFDLPSEPLSNDDIDVLVVHDKIVSGKPSSKYERIIRFSDFEYHLLKGEPGVMVNIPKLCEVLKKRLRKDMGVTITVAYVEK
jgi:hypothetical protein